MLEVEKWLARVLLLNSGLTLTVCLGLLGVAPQPDQRMTLFGVALLGFVAAVLSLRRHRAGLWGGMLYYALQVVSYYRYDESWQFSIKAGVSIGLTLQFAQGVLVLNLVALALLAASAFVRHRRPAR